ncbi:MAG: transketolase [Acidobacteriota bacterium]
MSPQFSDRDQLAVNTIRFLAVDMVEKANSGHPGAPLGQAAMAYLLWTRFLRHDPARPDWLNRDRFVLSCGHASALLYSLLHLAGYGLSIEEIQRFRQLGSKTPGHPEHGHTVGVETTTGPLGQGIGNAVGMAMAREMLAARFNRPGQSLIDYRVWAVVSDGDLMEGVASEACSLAGHQQLGCLKVLYDSNHISIDGPTSLSFSQEDVGGRFAAYGWRVLRVEDGNDLVELDRALAAAEAETGVPTIVVVRTHIGFGSPKQDSKDAHGEPLGAADLKATKEKLGWPLTPAFLVPDETRAVFAESAARGASLSAHWDEVHRTWGAKNPEAAMELNRRLRRELPQDWQNALPAFTASDGAMATRDASGKVLDALAAVLPELVGGSADLTPSNKTLPKGATSFSPADRTGRYLRFGVREHGMGAALNGIALSGLLIPYGGTFLIFSDYMRPAVRLAALMGQQSIFVYTHDSIFLGEDGPTHQPVSQLLSLRSIPGLVTLRPADAVETAEAWRFAIEHRDGPTAMALTRQKLPVLPGSVLGAREGLRRGAYVVSEAEGGAPRALLLASGSEVSLVIEGQRRLQAEGIPTRVVSFPSWELFDRQPKEYRDSVLPPAIRARLAVEAATPMGWQRYVGLEGDVLGQEGYGASAPAADLAIHFGYTPENVVARLKRLLAG